jgi:hypothetical protein
MKIGKTCTLLRVGSLLIQAAGVESAPSEKSGVLRVRTGLQSKRLPVDSDFVYFILSIVNTILFSTKNGKGIQGGGVACRTLSGMNFGEDSYAYLQA